MVSFFGTSANPGSRLIAEAVEVRRGQRTGLYRATITDEEGKLVAELHGMAYRQETRFLEEL